MRPDFRGWVTPATVGVISFAAGAGAGYLFKKYQYGNRLENLRAEIVDQSIGLEEAAVDVNQIQFQFDENLERMNSVVQQANRVIVNFIDGVNEAVAKGSGIQHTVTVGPSGPIEVYDTVKKTTEVKPIARAVAKRQIRPAVVEEVEGEFPVNENEDWNYEAELENRGPDHPYVIHRDEFFSNESEYRQSSLTYYKGDNILCDETDVPIYNPEKVVGTLPFGHGSQDPSIVYIRNDHLTAEYEVILDNGYFQTEVLGQHVEDDLNSEGLKHSIMKFRTTD